MNPPDLFPERNGPRARARAAIAATAARMGEPTPTTSQEARAMFGRALLRYFPKD